jgi:EAL domain-containing protein (putative c-di-GMP-specific phosphodiesterase class I)/GGDEF domain-containing protein
VKINSLYELKKHYNPILLILFTIISILIIDYIVYITGGTSIAFTHMMYIPIIISAFTFDIKGGVGVALLAGLTLGPLMPLNVSEGMMQEPISWILRIIFFVIIGTVTSLLFQRIKLDKENEVKKLFINAETGYPNSSKLKLDLNEMVNNKENFTLVAFKILNYDQVNIYVDYEVGKKSVLKVLEMLSELFEKRNIYSVDTNEMVVIMRKCNVQDAFRKAQEFLSLFEEPTFIDGLPIHLVIQSGIVNFPLHGKGENELFKNIGKTFDQEVLYKNRIAIYENSISQKHQENYAIVVAIYDAIKCNKFTIVYQPKINLSSNNVMGIEALLRWNNDIKGNMNIGELIKIAEDAGIISEITKWVIKNAINQLKVWQDEGINTKVAINISPKDLQDDSIIEYTKNCIAMSQIDPGMIEFELTERAIIEKRMKLVLDSIRDMGLKISLDDFGTGYNSFIHLVEIPIDFVKIDKAFIDNIKDMQTGFLVKGAINLVHNLGKKVIAEGVETQEQLEILKNMGCDNIQGYYFSKPLPPEKLKEFILKYNYEQISL